MRKGKKVGMSTLFSDRVDKEGHFIVTKGSIYQEDKTILNMSSSRHNIVK